ncbi:MAG: DUF4301 family protein [Flavobacteriaceae bacterium]|nr:DUF4301 family protein [Flavobacteriaceae bacterium]
MTDLNLTEADISQLNKMGITQEQLIEQLEIFQSGLPFTNLVAAAVPGNGLLKLDDQKKRELTSNFENKLDSIDIIKFVPASGAATRMFKFLFQFLKDYNPDEMSINSYINKNNARELYTFFVGLEKLPFYHIVQRKLEELYPDFSEYDSSKQRYLFVKTLLDKDALNYGNYPKGLLPFHLYKKNVISTAFEEHLFESALYSSPDEPAQLHFTISEEYKDRFKKEFSRIEEGVESITGSTFEIDFSYQHQSTDTISVDMDNKPFRLADGSLYFRPSGHGALIDNLNKLDADLIFIKNIDNVVVNKYKKEVAENKKILAGLMLEVQQKVFGYLEQLDEEVQNEDQLYPIIDFLENQLNVRMSKEFHKYKLKFQVEYLQGKLNRPLRVCGMVKNEGEPGGGPFWVKNEEGVVSLQIVESAQIDTKNKKQAQILAESTHFNPVDIVCGVRDYKGNKFDLLKYVDYKSAFITKKTRAGKELKALERPGLWNGAMAEWNTIFVEVPLITFNPVKTVNDLLKAAHQVK